MNEVATGQAPRASYEISLPHYVDSTMLATWRSCKHKHLWSTLWSLYPTGRSVHLVAGGAFAAGLEAARKAFFLHGVRDHEGLLMAAYPAFLHEWGDYDPPPGRNYKTFVNTFYALHDYLLRFPPGEDSIQPFIRADGSPAVEYTFSIPLEVLHPDGHPMLYVGRFDLLGVFTAGGITLPCITDEKTTGGLGFAWQDQWDLRGQFIGYVWACRQAGIDIRHAAIRGIAIQQTQEKVLTALVEYANHMIDRWHRQMLTDVRLMVAHYEVFSSAASKGEVEPTDPNGIYYQYNFADACSSYGGCAFTTLCQAKDPSNYLTNYIKHRWNPLLKNPVEEVTKE